MPRAADLRLHAYRHNALRGSVLMAKRNMVNIQTASSATPKAIELALAAEMILEQLALELHTYRREPDGVIVRPKHADEEKVEKIRHGL